MNTVSRFTYPDSWMISYLTGRYPLGACLFYSLPALFERVIHILQAEGDKQPESRFHSIRCRVL